LLPPTGSISIPSPPFSSPGGYSTSKSPLGSSSAPSSSFQACTSAPAHSHPTENQASNSRESRFFRINSSFLQPDMKKIITCLLAVLGMTTACGQKNYEDVDVAGFAALIADSTVIVLDVRTADEFSDGHIGRAVNIDVKQSDFLEKAKAMLPSGKTIAVYCRSGRRSANACNQLSAEGYKTFNLKGGIIAWTEEIPNTPN